MCRRVRECEGCVKSSQSRKAWLPGRVRNERVSSLSVIEACDQSKCKREGKRRLKHLEPLERGLEGGVYKTLFMPSYSHLISCLPGFSCQSDGILRGFGFGTRAALRVQRHRRIDSLAPQGALDLLKTHASKLQQRGTPHLTFSCSLYR